jgi:hypothetical protein
MARKLIRNMLLLLEMKQLQVTVKNNSVKITRIQNEIGSLFTLLTNCFL